MTDRLLTIQDLMAYLQVSRTTAYQMIWRGKIPHVRVGRQIRIRQRDVEAYLDQSSNERQIHRNRTPYQQPRKPPGVHPDRLAKRMRGTK